MEIDQEASSLTRILDLLRSSKKKVEDPNRKSKTRLNDLQDLADLVRRCIIHSDLIEELWDSISDLLPGKPAPALTDSRRIALELIVALVEGQHDRIPELMRLEIFELLVRTDTGLRISLRQRGIAMLVDSGKKCHPFVDGMINLLLGEDWINQYYSLKEVQSLVFNVIKYHFPILEEKVQVKLLNQVLLRCNSAPAGDLNGWLDCLSAVLESSGGVIPGGFSTVQEFVYSLCISLNLASKQSWEIMSRLLHSLSGHDTMHALVIMLEEASGSVPLLRGAVFFVGMSCWGSQRIPTLKWPFLAVIPALLSVTKLAKHDLVICEVLLSVRRLIKKYGSLLRSEWDFLIDLLEVCHSWTISANSPNLVVIISEILAAIQDLYAEGKFMGIEQQFVSLLILYKPVIDSSTSAGLLVHLELRSNPGHSLDWLENLSELMTLFFLHESDVDLQTVALSKVKELILHSTIFALPMIHSGVVPFLPALVNSVQKPLLVGTSVKNPAPDSTLGLEALALITTCALKPSPHFPSLFSSLLQALSLATHPVVRSACLTSILNILLNSAFNCSTFNTWSSILALLDDRDVDIRRGILRIITELRFSSGLDHRVRLQGRISPYLTVGDVTNPSSGVLSFQPLISSLLRRLQLETDPKAFNLTIRLLDSCITEFHMIYFSEVDVCSLLAILAHVLSRLCAYMETEYDFVHAFKLIKNCCNFSTSLSSANVDQVLTCLISGLEMADDGVFQECASSLITTLLKYPHLLNTALPGILAAISKRSPVKFAHLGNLSSRSKELELCYLLASTIVDTGTADRVDPVYFASSLQWVVSFWSMISPKNEQVSPIKGERSSESMDRVPFNKNKQLRRLCSHCLVLWFSIAPLETRVSLSSDILHCISRVQVQTPSLELECISLSDFISRMTHAKPLSASDITGSYVPNLLKHCLNPLPATETRSFSKQGLGVITVTTCTGTLAQIAIRRPTGVSTMLLRCDAPLATYSNTVILDPGLSLESLKPNLPATPVNTALRNSPSVSELSLFRLSPTNEMDMEDSIYKLAPLPSYDYDDDNPISPPPPSDSSFSQYVSGTHPKEDTSDPGFLFRQLESDTNVVELNDSVALQVLDRSPSREVIKIGVVYVNAGQEGIVDILSNTVGSPGYRNFLRGLGQVELLQGTSRFTGGLDRKNDEDGKYGLFWSDGLTEISYHVSTMIPTLKDFRFAENKRRLIGNDSIVIVYTEESSLSGFDMGHVASTLILVYPLDGCGKNYRVRVVANEPSGPLGEEQLVSGDVLGYIVRMCAVHVHMGLLRTNDYLLNWSERLRQIRALHVKPEKKEPTRTVLINR